MDNSTEQNKDIMDYQRKLSAGQIDQSEEQGIRNQVKNVQRMLKPITVKNPYATFLQLPEAVFKPRRTMLLLLLFTETITYYHQYQRVLKTDTDTGEQYIESTIEDVENAFTLLENTILKKSDELNDACRSFFERLKEYLKEKDTDSFYRKEIRSAMRISPSSIGRYLYELERMGYVKIVRSNRYKGFEYKVQSWNDLAALVHKLLIFSKLVKEKQEDNQMVLHQGFANRELGLILGSNTRYLSVNYYDLEGAGHQEQVAEPFSVARMWFKIPVYFISLAGLLGSGVDLKSPGTSIEFQMLFCLLQRAWQLY